MQKVCRWGSRWEVAGSTVNCVQPQPWQERVMKPNKVQTGKGNASWNVDNHNNSSIDWDEDPRHNTRWQTLRKCNIVLERIDEVPDDPGDVDFKTRSRGEAYFMRALVFWEGVYRYGGLPIIHRRINPSEDGKLPVIHFPIV